MDKSPSSRSPLPSEEGDVELLYESPSSRVFRRGDGVVCKRTLGVQADERLRRERDILARLAGVGGAVQLADPTQAEGLLVVHDTRGISLAARLEIQRLGVDEVLDLAPRIAQALACIHRAGVVHRDICPANILLSPGASDGGASPLFIDFDRATCADVYDGQAGPGGSLEYAAPELTGRTGGSVDQRADLYSLGATLYEMSVGLLPFPTQDALDLMHDQLVRQPVAPSQANPSLPAGFSAIVLRLLAKEPEARYQSAEGLACDLERVRDELRTGRDGLFTLGERDFPARLSPGPRLVGREGELAQLRAVFDAALHGPRQAVLVEGAPGVGKSSLIGELRPMVHAAGGWFLYGKFDAYGKNAESGGAIAQALRALGSLLLALPVGELASTRQRVLDGLGANAGLMARLLPEFGVLLGEQPMGALLDPTRAEERMIQMTLGLLTALATSERPLVLVLDDLQWAGPLALRIFALAMNEPSLRGLVLVGALRNRPGDVSADLASWLDKAAALPCPPLRISLTDLQPQEIAALLAKMLRLPQSQSASLMEALGPLATGNPFDLVESVNALRREGLLALDGAGWSWNADDIQRSARHRDVPTLLAERIGDLAAPSRTLLETMSCLGTDVELTLLQAAAGLDAEKLQERLRALVDEGFLIADTARAMIRFRHDHVQQAVLAILEHKDRGALHLDVARRLAPLPAWRMEAAQQFLGGAQRLADRRERGDAARLLHWAAVRMMRVASFEPAMRYLTEAIALLPAESEPAHARDLALRVEAETGLHLALFGQGRLTEADALFAAMQARITDPVVLIESACLQIRALDVRGRTVEALALGAGLLAQLGMQVPEGYEDPRVEERLDAVSSWVRWESRQDLSTLKPLSDPRLVAVARLLSRMVRSAYFLGHSRAVAWLLLEVIRLWSTHGPCAPLAAVLARMSIVLVARRKDYRTAYEVARHVLAVSESLHFDPEIADARHLFGVYGSFWFEPVDESVRQVLRAAEGMQTAGDPSYACYVLLHATPLLFNCAATLDELDEHIEQGLALSKRTSNLHTTVLGQIDRQLVRLLRGRTHAPTSLDDDEFNEQDVLARAGLMPFVPLWCDEARLLACTVMGDMSGLARSTATSAPLVDPKGGHELSAMPSYCTNLNGYVAVALLRAEQLRRDPDVDAGARLDKLRECCEWLAARAADAPHNFRHLALLAQAHLAWVTGDRWNAATTFDAAMREAVVRERPWHRALIVEHAGRFHIQEGLASTGRELLAEACALYAAWGALGKVRKMQAEHPWLQGVAVAPVPGHVPGAGATADSLDLLGVLRASQALSSETSLDRLATRVKEVLAALTGATHVHLLSCTDGQWSLLMSQTADLPSGAVPVAEAAASGHLPMAPFAYVARTGQLVLVDDVEADDRFARDPYFVGRTHCSLLVLPIAGPGGDRAMLLLESHQRRAAFAAQRLDAVRLIAGQLAVSLANVQLYDSLEQRVNLRTEELRATQARLVSTARRAGMAEIATNVLHNVGNVLNSVNVAAELLEGRLRHSSGQRLARVVNLLDAHANELEAFLQHDERGRNVRGYLAELANALDAERADALQEIDGLRRRVNHIKEIVRSQQTYAGASSLREPVQVSTLLEEALRVSAAAAARPDVSVVRCFEEVPEVVLDRPRLLQIMVNLIANANDAMAAVPAGSRRLTLGMAQAAGESGPCLRITVRDEGHGIDPADLPRIFSHGFTTKEKGHGFGLHSCALAAMEMGGRLRALSDGPGSGATFTLELPLESAEGTSS